MTTMGSTKTKWIRWNLVSSVDINWTVLKCNSNQWKANGAPMTTMTTNGDKWKAMCTNATQWKSMVSMETFEIQNGYTYEANLTYARMCRHALDYMCRSIFISCYTLLCMVVLVQIYGCKSDCMFQICQQTYTVEVRLHGHTTYKPTCNLCMARQQHGRLHTTSDSETSTSRSM